MNENNDHHKTVALITELLEKENCDFKLFEHEAVRTSEEAARVRPEYTLAQGAKALIVRLKRKGTSKAEEKRFAEIVIPGDRRFDVKKARSELGAKDIRFASENEVSEITGGIKPGGVPPFGNLFGLPVYADEGVFDNEELIFNAGDRRVSIAMRTDDFKRVVKPHIVAITNEDA